MLRRAGRFAPCGKSLSGSGKPPRTPVPYSRAPAHSYTE